MASNVIPFPVHAVIPKDGAAHIVRTDCCEPHLSSGQWAIIDFSGRANAEFLLVKEFGKNPEIITRQMQIDHPRRRVLGEVVGRYEYGSKAA